ncbi:hypothetical protein DQ04_01671110 [Trypanosoma grayi]|uniref:hypothetical protein n=1 Tax=Trypanosoma grayi TaxID=71804 RepID=UPI0004F4034D|nr:hypothetical protein DQ04_01671110 [Trypanosoma grayi]KEG12494.1 hypothetical protein DQ04_01671110 [Trypanosoma grayi]
MASEEGDVRVVQDTTTYTKAIRKDAQASWVRGLTPVEDEEELQQRRAVALRKARAASPVATPSRRKHWLRVPILLGFMSSLIILHNALWGPARRPLDFPVNEEELWEFSPRFPKGLMVFLMEVWQLWSTSTICALFGLTLSWTIGTSARHFVALCGVGISLLSLIAVIGQLILLWTACGISRSSGKDECDVPFVLYYTLSVFRTLGPLLAVWCVGPVLDVVWDSGWQWRLLLGSPVFIYAVAAVGEVQLKEQLLSSVPVYLTLLAWGKLLLSCIKEKPFRVVFEVKEHGD